MGEGGRCVSSTLGRPLAAIGGGTARLRRGHKRGASARSGDWGRVRWPRGEGPSRSDLTSPKLRSSWREAHTQTWSHGSCRSSGGTATADEVFAAFSEGAVRATAMLRAQPPDRQQTIRRIVRRKVEQLGANGEYVIPVPAALSAISCCSFGPAIPRPCQPHAGDERDSNGANDGEEQPSALAWAALASGLPPAGQRRPDSDSGVWHGSAFRVDASR